MKHSRRGIDSDNRYQHRFLSDANGRILVDYGGRYERLQDDFNEACDIIGIQGTDSTLRVMPLSSSTFVFHPRKVVQGLG